MRLFVLLFILNGSSVIHAQETPVCDSVYQFVDEEPQFEGGAAAMSKWFINNLKYPESGIDPETGTIYFKLLIDSNGVLRKISIENSSQWTGLDISGFQASVPNFSPGKISGKAVCTEMRVLLSILLD